MLEQRPLHADVSRVERDSGAVEEERAKRGKRDDVRHEEAKRGEDDDTHDEPSP